MTPERWREVERLYHAILCTDPSQSSASLGRLCGSDSELRREVKSLFKRMTEAVPS